MSTLPLTRKVGQAILIGEDVEVRIDRAENGVVRVAVTAPRETTILRDEVVCKGTQCGCCRVCRGRRRTG